MSTKDNQDVAQSRERGIMSTNAHGFPVRICPNSECTIASCLQGDECGFNEEDSESSLEVSSLKELPMSTTL